MTPLMPHPPVAPVSSHVPFAAQVFPEERTEPVPLFLQRAETMPVLDVRSPAEFAQGHVPGAISLPLLDNDERVEIGTLYKQQGRDTAFARGLELITPKIPHFLEVAQQATAHGTGQDIAVYCWRGGERSLGMARLLHGAGYGVWRLGGGYKAFRNYVLDLFQQPVRLLVLGGQTGVGKTAVLHAMAAQGAQVVDLEHLARHRGSAFGSLPHEGQPTCEHFENRLAMALRRCSVARPVWVEDESEKLGKVRIPQALFQVKEAAPGVLLEAATAERLTRIVEEYGTLAPASLAQALEKIQKRLGSQQYHAALALLEVGDIATLAGLLLAYYDKGYARQMRKRAYAMTITGTTPEETARRLLDLEAQLVQQESH